MLGMQNSKIALHLQRGVISDIMEKSLKNGATSQQKYEIGSKKSAVLIEYWWLF